MFAFILGCMYLLVALICLWLHKERFNFIGFIYNPKNRGFFLILDAPFILLSSLAILEERHWILVVLFLMHFINSFVLAFMPNYFYSLRDEGQLMADDSLINSMALMSAAAGITCLVISYL